MKRNRLKAKKKLACNNKSRRIQRILKRKHLIAERRSLAFVMLHSEA